MGGIIPVFCGQRGLKDVDFQYKFITMAQLRFCEEQVVILADSTH